jgi:Putative zinc-finger
VSHLGDRASALVDGQLSPDAAERATAHLAACRPCRDLVELERLTKIRLVSLQGPAPTADLVGRLLAMGGPAGPLPPRPGHVPGMPRPQTVPLRTTVGARSSAASAASMQATAVRPARRPVPTRPAGRAAGHTQRRTRLAAVMLGALSVMGVGVAGVTISAASSGAAPRPATPTVGTVSSPIGASVITTSVARQNSFGWLQDPAPQPAGRTQRLLVRR